METAGDIDNSYRIRVNGASVEKETKQRNI